MRIASPTLLALCIALAACQGGSSHSEQAAAPTLQLQASVQKAENARLLPPLPFWPQAAQLLVAPGRDGGLRVLDAEGHTLSALAGRYEHLDQRTDADGLLVASLDRRRQQAVLLRLDAQHQWGPAHYLAKTDFAIEGLCLYRDSARNDFLFLVGEEGVGEQWLIAENGRPLAEARRVRGLSLPPESGFCQVDDAHDALYVNEENVGLWRYAAAAEAPLQRTPVDLRAPFGGFAKATAGMALVPGGLLALDPAAASLHLYQRQGDAWQAAATLALPGLEEPEQISARADASGLQLLIVDDAGSHSAHLDWSPRAEAEPPALPSVRPLQASAPVPSLGDAADDPAIWQHPTDPRRSRVLGTDKQGGLLVYDLAGQQLQDLRVGRLNNVDVRPGFTFGERVVDLAVATHRDHNSLQLFAIERDSGQVSAIGEVPTPLAEVYGLCLLKTPDGQIDAILNDKDGTFLQYRLSGAGGQVSGTLLRRFSTPSQPEGCVADDRNQRLYIGEEDVAVWNLDARGDAAAALEQVMPVGGLLKDDIEGLALYHGQVRDYLVISSQGNDSYVVVEAAAPYRVRGAFRVGLNAAAGIDGASETDGLEVTSANLGGPWSQGLLVVQDGRKRMPEDNQNYKYVPWSAVADALGLE